MCIEFLNFAYILIQIVHIHVIVTHLKLWVAIARHNFKWMKNKLFNLAV